MKSTRFLIPVLALLLLIGCSKTPSGIIGKEKMARIIADLSIAEAIIETDSRSFPDDSSKIVLKQSIFAKNRVTPEQVDTSLRWYGRNMDILVEVYDRAIEMTEADMKKNALNSTPSISTAPRSIYATEGDSVNLWSGPAAQLFAAIMPANIITFSVSSDRNWEKGDIFVVSAKALGAVEPVQFVLTAEYQDGSREYVANTVTGSKWNHLKLPMDPEKAATSVHGYILYTPRADEVVALDSISLVKTRHLTGAPTPRHRVKSFATDYEHLH